MNEITLQQWKAEKEEKLRAFELHWKRMMQEEDSDLPNSLHNGEWDEQFDFFCEEV